MYKKERRVGQPNDRGPSRPKVEFPHFSGGGPCERLDKAEYYLQVYEIPREKRVSTTCFYIDGKASK